MLLIRSKPNSARFAKYHEAARWTGLLLLTLAAVVTRTRLSPILAQDLSTARQWLSARVIYSCSQEHLSFCVFTIVWMLLACMNHPLPRDSALQVLLMLMVGAILALIIFFESVLSTVKATPSRPLPRHSIPAARFDYRSATLPALERPPSRHH